MIQPRFFLSAALVTAAMLLSGCGSIAGASWPQSTLIADTLYVTQDGNVHAVNPTDGSARWKFNRDSIPESTANRDLAQHFWGAVVPQSESSVLITSYNQALFRVSASGSLEWSFDAEPKHQQVITSNVGATSDQMYFATGKTLHALNTAGTTQWQFTSTEELWSAPSIASDRLYLPSMDHTMYALNPKTGEKVWGTDLGAALASPPTVVGQVLYTGSLSDKVFALAADSGKMLWEFATQGWVWGSPLVVDDSVYVADLRGNVYAVNAADGKERWRVTVTGGVRGELVQSELGIFLNTDKGFLFCLNPADGSVVWKQNIDSTVNDRLLAAPVLSGDLVMVTAMDAPNLVYAFQQATGAAAWQYAGK